MDHIVITACVPCLPLTSEVVPQVVELIQDCWTHDAAARPAMAVVAKRLRKLVTTVKGRLSAERHKSDALRRSQLTGSATHAAVVMPGTTPKGRSEYGRPE